jgi:hypothetical protein
MFLPCTQSLSSFLGHPDRIRNSVLLKYSPVAACGNNPEINSGLKAV